jgi:hypothetical protein
VVSASDPRALQKGYAAGPGDRWLRLSVLLAVAAEIAFLMFLTAFLWNHANPMGDGMEMVGASAAFMFVFLPFTLPALILAKERRHLVVAAFLAGVAAFLYFAFWFETLAELGIREAPWS